MRPFCIELPYANTNSLETELVKQKKWKYEYGEGKISKEIRKTSPGHERQALRHQLQPLQKIHRVLLASINMNTLTSANAMKKWAKQIQNFIRHCHRAQDLPGGDILVFFLGFTGISFPLSCLSWAELLLRSSSHVIFSLRGFSVESALAASSWAAKLTASFFAKWVAARLSLAIRIHSFLVFLKVATGSGLAAKSSSSSSMEDIVLYSLPAMDLLQVWRLDAPFGASSGSLLEETGMVLLTALYGANEQNMVSSDVLALPPPYSSPTSVRW
jgi:hypothetical protein